MLPIGTTQQDSCNYRQLACVCTINTLNNSGGYCVQSFVISRCPTFDVECILPCVPWHPPCLYAGTEPKLRCRSQMSKSYGIQLFFFVHRYRIELDSCIDIRYSSSIVVRTRPTCYVGRSGQPEKFPYRAIFLVPI